MYALCKIVNSHRKPELLNPIRVCEFHLSFYLFYRNIQSVGMETPQKQPAVYIERDRHGLFGLHVSNIAPELNEDDLRSLFQTSGFIKVCKIITYGDKSRVAFVKFDSQEEAMMGLKKVSGTTIGDFVLDVRPAYESCRKGQKWNKDKSLSPESFSKQDVRNQRNVSSMVNGATPGEDSKTMEAKDDKEMGNRTSGSLSKSTEEQAPKTYVLPPASQDVRYSNGSTGSSSSMESFNNKSPLKPSTFNTRQRDNPRQTAANFEGLKKTDHAPHAGHAKIKTETVSIVKNHLPSGKQLEKKMGQMNLGNNTPHQKGHHAQMNTNVSKWTVEEVAKYFQRQEECTVSMVTFIKEQEIDGDALMLIEEGSLLHFMKLGPALKFLNLREKLKN